MFRMPTISLVEAQRDNGAPAYNYLFSYRTTARNGTLGAMHGLDLPILFGSFNREFTGVGPETERLSRALQDSSITFVRSGDPSCETIGTWPVYGQRRMTMIFDINTRVEEAPYETERLAWGMSIK